MSENTKRSRSTPQLLILNQMAGPLTWELAEDLSEDYCNVALLTGHPDTLAKGSREKLRLFPAVPYDRGNYPKRVVSWLRYMRQALRWVWRRPRRAPVLLFSNPPFLPWLGYFVHRLRGQKYAVMVHDIYPDVMTQMGKMSATHPVAKLWNRFNRNAYENAEVVMTLGEQMAETLARQFDPTKTPAGRIEIIYPWADTEFLRPQPKESNWFAEKHGQLGKLTVMYSGNMGLGHDIETMLEAARILHDQPDIHFMFIGAGPKWELVEKTQRDCDLKNITLLSWQDEDVLPYSLSTCDVALVSLDEGAEGIAFPSKSIYAMCAGSALLGLSRHPSDLSLLIERYGCGVNIEPGDAAGVVSALRHWRDDKTALNKCREAARHAVESDLSRSVSVAKVWAKIKPLLA